jgi:hypothetical protein
VALQEADAIDGVIADVIEVAVAAPVEKAAVPISSAAAVETPAQVSVAVEVAVEVEVEVEVAPKAGLDARRLSLAGDAVIDLGAAEASVAATEKEMGWGVLLLRLLDLGLFLGEEVGCNLTHQFVFIRSAIISLLFLVGPCSPSLSRLSSCLWWPRRCCPTPSLPPPTERPRRSATGPPRPACEASNGPAQTPTPGQCYLRP